MKKFNKLMLFMMMVGANVHPHPPAAPPATHTPPTPAHTAAPPATHTPPTPAHTAAPLTLPQAEEGSSPE